MGVLAVRPGSAITACAPLTHWSQMYVPGPAISFLTCFWLFQQNEHDRRSPESGTRPLYPDSGIGQRRSSTVLSELAPSRRFAARRSGLAFGLALAVRPAGLAEVSRVNGAPQARPAQQSREVKGRAGLSRG